MSASLSVTPSLFIPEGTYLGPKDAAIGRASWQKYGHIGMIIGINQKDNKFIF